MTVFFIIISVILIISITPVGAFIYFNDGEIKISAKLAFFKFTVFPLKRKEGKAKSKVKKVKKSKKKNSEKTIKKTEEKKENVKLKISDFIDLACEFQRILRAKLSINNLKLFVIIASSDPYKTAMSNAKACTLASNIIDPLELAFNIKKRKIAISPDFLTKKGRIYCELDITIKIYQILQIGFKLLLMFLEKRKIREQEKQSVTQKI